MPAGRPTPRRDRVEMSDPGACAGPDELLVGLAGGDDLVHERVDGCASAVANALPADLDHRRLRQNPVVRRLRRRRQKVRVGQCRRSRGSARRDDLETVRRTARRTDAALERERRRATRGQRRTPRPDARRAARQSGRVQGRCGARNGRTDPNAAPPGPDHCRRQRLGSNLARIARPVEWAPRAGRLSGPWGAHSISVSLPVAMRMTLTASPMTPARRLSPLGPLSMSLVFQFECSKANSILGH